MDNSQRPQPAQHTPGPWKVNYNAVVTAYRTGADGKHEGMARTEVASILNEYAPLLAERDRLQATNADLLDALERIAGVEVDPGETRLHECRKVARAALNAAKGGQS